MMQDLKPILAIDPGNTKSAYVVWNGKNILEMDKVYNTQLRMQIPEIVKSFQIKESYIEMIASYGMKVGDTVFDTCVAIGRFQELLSNHCTVRMVERKQVLKHHCGTVLSNDSVVRAKLIEKYGQPGTKKNPGLLYGVTADIWSALAIATMQTEIAKIKSL